MLTIGWWQNYQSLSKKFRSDERVYDLKEYVRCGVLARIGLHDSLLGIEFVWTTRLSELPTVTEEGLLTIPKKNPTTSHIKAMTTTTWSWMNNDRKNSLIQSICLNKSTRQYHKQHTKQSTDLRRHLQGPYRFAVSERTNWKVKKLDDIDARNIRTSLYDSLIALYTENYSYLWRSRTKINMTPVITSGILATFNQTSWPGVIKQNVSNQLVHGMFQSLSLQS